MSFVRYWVPEAHLKSTDKSVKWDTRFTAFFSAALFYDFQLPYITICCQNTVVAFATTNQNNINEGFLDGQKRLCIQ